MGSCFTIRFYKAAIIHGSGISYLCSERWKEFHTGVVLKEKKKIYIFYISSQLTNKQIVAEAQ